jgi:hypothetical protein
LSLARLSSCEIVDSFCDGAAAASAIAALSSSADA